MRVTYDPLTVFATGTRELAPGVGVPATMTADVTGPELPFDLTVTVTLESGRFVCERLACARKQSGPPITTLRIRQVPVAAIAHQVANACLVHVDGESPEQAVITPFSWEEVRHAAEQGPTDETLRGVALLYRFAYASWKPPAKAVMDELGLPRSTAGRWISMARRRGYLGTTRERKAGVD